MVKPILVIGNKDNAPGISYQHYLIIGGIQLSFNKFDRGLDDDHS